MPRLLNPLFLNKTYKFSKAPSFSGLRMGGSACLRHLTGYATPLSRTLMFNSGLVRLQVLRKTWSLKKTENVGSVYLLGEGGWGMSDADSAVLFARLKNLSVIFSSENTTNRPLGYDAEYYGAIVYSILGVSTVHNPVILVWAVF